MIKKLFSKQQDAVVVSATDWAVLLLGVAVFAIISLWTITWSSIWFDEAFSAYIIQFDFFEIAKYTANDVHPPLYYWLLKIWSMLFGTTELALRSMSVFFASIAIVVGFLLVKRLFGRRAAWISLVLMVLTPMLVRYGQEARMYTLATAISVAATYVLTFAGRTKKRWPWVVYGVLVSLGMWTHYFTAVVWIAHWVWRAWAVRYEGGVSKSAIRAFFSKGWIGAHLLAVGLYLPWLPLLVYQVVNVQVNGFWIPPVSPTTFTNFLTNVLFYQDQGQVTPWLSFVFFVILIGVIVLAISLYRTHGVVWRSKYMLLFAIAFVPVIILFILSLPPLRSSFVDRYLIPSTLGISLFLGVTLAASMRQKMRTLQAGGLVLLIAGSMVIGIANVYHLGNYNKTLHASNNTRQVIEAIKARSPEGQPIIADTPWLYYEAAAYATDKHPVYFIDAKMQYQFGSLDMLRYNDQHKIKDLQDFSRDNEEVWYLARPGSGSVPAPQDDWQDIQGVRVNDSISNQPAYEAIQYRTR